MFTGKIEKTKSTTIQAFERIYSGPTFLIHYKYSTILNLVYTSFFFGPGLPILFPISFCALAVLYLVERLMIAYSYQRPPMYDNTLNNNTIRMLHFAPLLYSFQAAILYSNTQVFRNEIIEN